MNTCSFSHLSDATLQRDLKESVARECTATARQLGQIAEFDARKLYLPAGYPSMYAYCVHELHLSEDTAYKRIRAARAARRFPTIFEALAQGRLNLSAVVMLAPSLTPENADELLTAATRLTRPEIERFLARRFPRPDLPTRLEALWSSPDLSEEPFPLGNIEPSAPGRIDAPVVQLAPGPVEPPAQRAKMTPLSSERIALQVTINQSTHDNLRYAQALLSHQIPSGDIAAVLDRALSLLVRHLERAKFASTATPRPRHRRSTAGARHIPADVKRAVWERDRGQCTFVSDTGHRCEARTFLEFDHVDPVARGGRATAGRMRLRCRAHNQYEAERTFGTAFMSHKRLAARHAAEEKRAKFAARETHARSDAAERAAEARARSAEAEQAQERDVIPWLRQLGFRPDEARRAAAHCETIPDASLEERVRVALSYLSPRARFRTPATPRGAATTPTPQSEFSDRDQLSHTA